MRPGPDELAKIYKDFAGELQDFREAWQKLVPILLQENQKIFGSQGAPLAEAFPRARIPWEDRTNAYARNANWYKFRRKGGKRKKKLANAMLGPVNRRSTLSLTGKLFAKLSSPSAARIRKMSVSYGVYSLPYARAVMFGHPMRPFVGKTARIMGASRMLLNERLTKIIDRIRSQTDSSRGAVMAGA
jgi:hypothetical protein